MQNKQKITEQAKHKLQRASSLLRSSSKIEESEVLAATTSKLNEIIEEELSELEKDEIEIFDDYLEMIMTFGYITLFAAAFPFGTTIMALFIYLETKQDCFKLVTVCRRPFSRK